MVRKGVADHALPERAPFTKKSKIKVDVVGPFAWKRSSTQQRSVDDGKYAWHMSTICPNLTRLKIQMCGRRKFRQMLKNVNTEER